MIDLPALHDFGQLGVQDHAITAETDRLISDLFNEILNSGLVNPFM